MRSFVKLYLKLIASGAPTALVVALALIFLLSAQPQAATAYGNPTTNLANPLLWSPLAGCTNITGTQPLSGVLRFYRLKA